jgi:hypothetical protein
MSMALDLEECRRADEKLRLIPLSNRDLLISDRFDREVLKIRGENFEKVSTRSCYMRSEKEIKSVLNLRKKGTYTFREIASKLNMPFSTVYQICKRRSEIA